MFSQRLIQAISPAHGRALIYVWAIDQDDLSKRSIPRDEESQAGGQDVFVPWVVQGQLQQKVKQDGTQSEVKGLPSVSPVFKRYYHMFAKGELASLVHEAANDMGLAIGAKDVERSCDGVEVVQDGWERSNYYVELRRWQCDR